MRLRVITLLGLCWVLPAHAEAPRTFSEAKKVAWKLYERQSTEFYCGCKYSGNRATSPARTPTVPRESSGNISCRPGRSVISANAGSRAGARTAARTIRPTSAPKPTCTTWCSFGWLPEQKGQYGSCLTQVDFKAKKVMPRPSIRGMIARTYFYMSKQYGLRLSKQDRQLFEAWNKTYPVQTWERQRNQSVACVMGRGNEFVGAVDLKACG